MSVTSSPTNPRTAIPNPSAELDASCCVPLLGLFGNGLLWLFVSSVFGLVASLKFHNPHFLADDPHWTYGRIHAAFQTAFLYGFAIPSALGVGLWLQSRLGRVPLTGPVVIFIATILWNLFVAVGLIGILCGDLTSFSDFEMPRYAIGMLFVSYLLIAICGLLTFHRRAESNLYPSQWFSLGSLIWFPWIFSAAAMLLLSRPVRGVMQDSIAWWYADNLSNIVLGFAGLASIFYFIPKLLGRPLYSTYLAVFAFLGLSLFGSWGGIPGGAPMPAWMISLSTVGTVLTTIPVLSVVVNLYKTARRDVDVLDSDVTLRFTYVALIFWFIANLQRIIGVLPGVSGWTNYTWFSVAQWELFHFGFVAFAFFGAIYYIVPRLIDSSETLPEWNPRLVRWHFWFMLVAVLVSYIALLVAGIGQGYLLGNEDYSFAQIMAGTLMPLRVSTLGDLMIVIATVFFILNFAVLLSRRCCAWIPKKGQP